MQELDALNVQQEALDEAISSIVLGELPVTFHSSLESALEHKHSLQVLKDELERLQTDVNPYTDQVVDLQNKGQIYYL